jgi:hypothetical membrane protein
MTTDMKMKGKMKTDRNISTRAIPSIIVAGCYLVFTIIAYLRFPLPYAPKYNWLSDLGNPDLSPAGAIFYNTGILLTAASLLVFYSVLFSIRIKNNKVQNAMTYLAVGFGWIGSLAMGMSAVYPINQPSTHSFFCMLFFFSLGTAYAFLIAALRYHSKYPRWLFGFGIIVVLVNMTVQIFFNDVPISEWINVPLLLVYCVLIGFSTQRALSH